jgi:hypothetical protein
VTLRVVVALVVAAGCAGGDGGQARDGAAGDGGDVVCAGDRWGGSPEMLAALRGCTVIAGNLSITGNDLTAAELPQLTKVGGFLTVWGNPTLTRAALPGLVEIGGYLEVSSNPALTSLELPALARLNTRAISANHDLVIRDNALPACRAEAIHQQLIARGFRGTASVSGSAGTCPP